MVLPRSMGFWIRWSSLLINARRSREPNPDIGRLSRWVVVSPVSAETIKRPLGEAAPSSFDKVADLERRLCFWGLGFT
jgi:hypothetical protein